MYKKDIINIIATIVLCYEEKTLPSKTCKYNADISILISVHFFFNQTKYNSICIIIKVI